MKKIEVDMPFLSFFGLGGTLFFLYFFVLTTVKVSAVLACIFLPFIALEFLLFLFCGRVSIDDTGIGYRNKLGGYFISWDEIDSIETGQGNFVIGNEQKWITMPVPGYWNGRNREEARQWIEGFVQSRDIHIKETSRAIFRFPKNTKVSSKQSRQTAK